MKKIYQINSWVLFCVFSLASMFGANAQVNTYGFSASSGAFTPLVGGITSGLAATADDNLSAALPIGFNFVYNGITYTTFKVNSNGALFFGTGNTGGGNDLATATASYRPGLAPLWDDLQCTEGITYQLSGTPTVDQKLTVEWKNMEWNYASGTPVISFQVILHEVTNRIDFVYRQEATAVNTGSASIGIMGTSPTDFISLQGAGTAPLRSTTVSANTIAFKPATGQIYSWKAAPTAPPAPTNPGPWSCASGTDISIAGSPSDSDVTWYWQGTNANGTSTANNAATPMTVMSNGTYYARSYNAVFNVWSTTSSSVVVSGIPAAVTPPAPTADYNPSCVTTGSQLSSVLTGNSDITYYWQGTTANGTSMANVAATDAALTAYNAPTSGTYYLNAFETSTSCWSTTSSIAISVQSLIPTAPVATPSTHNICGGLSDYDINATPQTAFAQTTSFGTNLISTGVTGGVTFPLTVPALPAGAVITSASLAITNVVTQNGSYLSEIRVALNSLYTLSATQISTTAASGTLASATIPLPGFPTTGGNLNLVLTETFNDAGASADATFGNVQLVINYTLPATVNWYDASTAGTQLGTGTTWDCIGNSVLADPASNGDYQFYAEGVTGACPSPRTLVTVSVLDVNVTLTPINETCTGYMNGSFEISDTLCGVIPFLVDVDGGGFGAIPTNLGPGTYTVTIQDNTMNTSAPMMVTIGTTDTYIPEAPTAAVDQYNICSGETTQLIEATGGGSGSVSITIATNYNWVPGANPPINGNISIPAGATITSSDIVFNNVTTTGLTWLNDLSFNLTGATTRPATLLGGGTSATNGGPYTFTTTSNPAGGAFTLNLTNNWTSPATVGTITLNITYTLPATTVEWYDMATNGNLEGTGSPFESIGTTLLPSPASAGSYEFYAGAVAGGCYSVDRTLVTINVNDVNVTLTPIDASCNGSATGSFDISDTLCGTIPFLVDVDGGGFGPIPTDLVAGTYQITVQDDNGSNSAVYTLVIGEAGAPTDAYMEDITDNGGQVSWNSNGNETEWNVEWGMPGFTPGTGNEIGSTQAMDTFAIITGLDGNTNYDVYVSANCGAGSTTGDWDMVNWTTDCGIYTLPFEETFEDNSLTRVCWYNENEDGTANWTYATGSSGGAITTAFEGAKNARFVSVGGTNTPITKLASPRFDFSGQDSVALIFAYGQEEWFGDQNTTKVYTVGASSSWTEVASYTANVNAWTLDTLYISDTTTQIAFEGINNFGYANVIDHVQILPCTLTPGIDGSSNVCRLDGTFDLNTIVTKGETFGSWSFAQNPGVLNGSIVNVSALPSGTFNFYYIVKTPCANDTTIATLTIFPPSSAGVDGTITACRNEPIYLLSGLSGNVDLGGQWYDPSNNPTNTSITTGNFPGSFNYDYIVSNGVCPNDTSNIVVTVGSCDYLDVQELVFGDMNVYPNPTEGLVFVSNASSSETFSYELLDIKGQVLSVKTAAIKGATTTEVSLEKLEPGVYMIRVYNSEAEKTFRVIKQ